MIISIPCKLFRRYVGPVRVLGTCRWDKRAPWAWAWGSFSVLNLSTNTLSEEPGNRGAGSEPWAAAHVRMVLPTEKGAYPVPTVTQLIWSKVLVVAIQHEQLHTVYVACRCWLSFGCCHPPANRFLINMHLMELFLISAHQREVCWV